MNFEDKVIVCKECEKEFDFTAGEQSFYEKNKFSEPVRCKACRDARKANKNAKNESYNNEDKAAA